MINGEHEKLPALAKGYRRKLAPLVSTVSTGSTAEGESNNGRSEVVEAGVVSSDSLLVVSTGSTANSELEEGRRTEVVEGGGVSADTVSVVSTSSTTDTVSADGKITDLKP